MTTTTELRGQTPVGYNLALAEPSIHAHEPCIATMAAHALPVLEEARGVVGVLRALSIRQGNMPRFIAESGAEWTLHHLIFLDDGTAALHVTRFKLH